MNKIQDKNQSKEISARFTKEFSTPKRKRSDFFHLVIILLITVAILIIGFNNFHPVFISFLIFELCFLFLILLPLIWILIKITIRTKNFDFGFQVFVYLQVVFYMFLASAKLGLLFENQPTNIKLLLDLIFYGMPLVLIGQTRLFKKSIFRNEWHPTTNASIILRQSLQVEEEHNGFSERPIFTEFQELEKYISSPTEFKTQFEKYCCLMGKMGELVDWDVTEDRVNLYPRFLIHSPNILKAPLQFINFIKAISSKTGLTTIEISYPSKQMMIKVAFGEYDILNREVTFHILALNILESLKKSLLAFFANDPESAFSMLIKTSE